ncbi:MAG: ABC transporter permease [Actinobacteria bacterium]|nr:ABC transporter permease [Actinomycetota bacterium]
MLALNEIRRGKGRFAAIVSALSLIVFLVLVLGALADGLFFGATGAVRNTSATGYVFASDAEGSLVRSRLPVSDVEKVAAAPGVEQAGPVGVLLTGGVGPDGPIDLAVFGIDPGGPGSPTAVEGTLPTEPGTAAVDVALRDAGVTLGSEVSVGDVSATVVGFTADSEYQLQPTLWTGVETWRSMRDAVRPELRGQTDVINSVAIVTAPDADLGAIAAAVPDTTVLTAAETGLAIPGVEQQSSTLNSIIYTTLAVAGLVVALFFALLVLEKRELFAALKALGASTGRLGRGVILQALIASALGVVIGAVVARLFDLVIPPEVPTLFRTETLLTIAVFTLVAGVVGAMFSLRRIAKIDPATAIGGAL